jgi:hypothetical protein
MLDQASDHMSGQRVRAYRKHLDIDDLVAGAQQSGEKVKCALPI